MLKHLTAIGLIVLLGVVFSVLVPYGIVPWLHDNVSPGLTPGASTIDGWLSRYQVLAQMVVMAGAAAALVWYALGAWSFRVVRLSEGRKRLVWALLLAAVTVVIVVAVVLTPPVQRGYVNAILGYAIVGLGCYYLATALLSPHGHKYAPPGAASIRRW